MNRISLTFSALIVLFTAALVHGNTISIVSEKAPAVIPFGQTQEFQFGTVPQANTTVLLKIKSRMDFPSIGGSLHFMRLSVNGKEVLPSKNRATTRLLNKPLASPVEAHLTVKWYDKNGWNVLYSPDFEAALARKYYVGDPYLYVFDITDLTNPIAENRVTIGNTAEPGFIQSHKFPDNKLDLVVGHLEIETKQGVSPMMVIPETPNSVVINRGEPAAGPAAYRGEILPGGGFALHIGDNTYHFASSISFPRAGRNRLAAGPFVRDGQKTWKVSAEGNRVTAQGPDYSLVRTITFGPRRIEIADAITNRHKDVPLGLSVSHEMDLKKLPNPSIRLCGNPDPSLTEYHSYGNPSVHVVTPEGGLAMLAEDDAFRRQVLLSIASDADCPTARAGIRTDMLLLAPGETYTMQWAVYPVAGPDYYDFINLVREDWDANYPALGPWRWGFQGIVEKSVEEIRSQMQRQKIRYVICPDWVEWTPNSRGTQRIAFASDVFSDYWAERRQTNLEFIKKLREAAPDVKVFWYFESARESVEDAPERFADSILRDDKGKPVMTWWKSLGATNPSYAMVPTLENSFGQTMLDVARRYMEEVKLDGIYWDEAEGIGQYGQILTSNEILDGRSCTLDPKTWCIEKKVGIVCMAGQPFRDEAAQIVRRNNGVLLCNGPCGSRQVLRDRVQRMIEIQHNDFFAYEGNLETPLGYLSWKTGWEEFIRALRMATLPAVCLTTVLPHEISPYLFPFTPIELHTGYLLGQERIITIHSGNYGWHGQHALARVRHFNRGGLLTETDFPTAINAREARTAVTLQPLEAVVLERLPMRFEPASPSDAQDASWQAEVGQVRYGQDAVSMHVEAPRGGSLVIEAGEFALQDGTVFQVRLGDKQESVGAAGGSLRVTVPAGYAGTVVIEKKK